MFLGCILRGDIATDGNWTGTGGAEAHPGAWIGGVEVDQGTGQESGPCWIRVVRCPTYSHPQHDPAGQVKARTPEQSDWPVKRSWLRRIMRSAYRLQMGSVCPHIHQRIKQIRCQTASAPTANMQVTLLRLRQLSGFLTYTC